MAEHGNIWCLNLIPMLLSWWLLCHEVYIVCTNHFLLNSIQREIFSSCKFSEINGNRVLYIAAMIGIYFAEKTIPFIYLYLTDTVFLLFCIDKDKGSILTWNTQTWERISTKYILRDAICAFNVSADGKFLAWYIFILYSSGTYKWHPCLSQKLKFFVLVGWHAAEHLQEIL